jgi:hypothetical protein
MKQMIERRRIYFAVAKPEPNSPEGAHIWGAASGEQAPFKGRGRSKGETVGCPFEEV